MNIDFYRDTNLEVSLAINYPQGMTSVYDAIVGLLKQRGKFVAEYENFTVEDARELSKSIVQDSLTYHVVRSGDKNVWGILRNSINSDHIRVLALFHGKIPDNLPSNMVVIDVGSSLHRKVPKGTVSDIVDSLLKQGVYPKNKTEDVYYGIQTLCYEVLYQPEYRMFPAKVYGKVPTASAFNFMFHPPQPLTDSSMRNAINIFVQDIHGNLE